MIIDFHTHTFPDAISGKIIDQLSLSGHVRAYTNASRPQLFESMKRASIDWAVNQPVHTRPDQVVKINTDLIAARQPMLARHFLTFGGMHPDFEDVRGELRRLKDNGIPGIKLHPAFQRTDLDDPRMLRIIAAASELDMIVLIHGGLDVSYPQHNFSSVRMVLSVLRQVQPPKLVVAHMGGWGCWNEVEHDLAGAPVWFDTAFSLGTVEPRPGDPQLPIRRHNLTDADFLRLARKHGTEHILFGTDSPWSDQSAYVRHVQQLALTDREREQILWKNAVSLLRL